MPFRGADKSPHVANACFLVANRISPEKRSLHMFLGHVICITLANLPAPIRRQRGSPRFVTHQDARLATSSLRMSPEPHFGGQIEVPVSRVYRWLRPVPTA